MLEAGPYERLSLCTTLEALTDEQFTAETLCAGWDAGDVAAHLIVREREPWTGPGLMLGGPFAQLTRRRQQSWRARGRERLETTLRAGPPPWLTMGRMAVVQAVEDWIHHQDIRRGGADLPKLDPTTQMQEHLWAALPRFARSTIGRLQADGVIAFTDGNRQAALRVTPDRKLATPGDAEADVTVSGPVSELLLYAVGRAAADVVISGDTALRAAMQQNDRRV